MPEPPTVNQQINWAKHNRYKYVRERKKYNVRFDLRFPKDPSGFPDLHFPWTYWGVVSVTYRLHNLRDPMELMAGCKWPIDRLVERAFLVDDSPRHLLGGLPHPTQTVDRNNRGLDIVLVRLNP